MTFGDPTELLVAEARALLAAAQRGEAVSADRARAFTRACIDMTEIGRLAMAVLDGGMFVGARLVGSAESVARQGAEAAAVGTVQK